MSEESETLNHVLEMVRCHYPADHAPDGYPTIKMRDLTLMARRIADLEQQLAQANAVIEKLPKTADGVPVVPGDRIISVKNGVFFTLTYRSGFMASQENPRQNGQRVSRCFSTHEAAERAAKEGV